MTISSVGRFPLNEVAEGDCRKLIADLPDGCVNVTVTSPPYWGQRMSEGNGVEDDPRAYLADLAAIFGSLLPKVKPDGLLWLNVGDAYNTPVNWRTGDHSYSTLGPGRTGLDPANSAYIKPRHKRKAFTDPREPWLRYGNLLALPYRLVIAMCDAGWLFRGEVIWRKRNPMPEGKCRPAAPAARDHLPVRPRGAASVPHRPAGRLRLGIQQREAGRAEALLPVP